MADYTPDLHLMESMRNSRLGWHGALAEMIDNSFDADALQVSIDITAKAVVVSDDGSGASDVLSMARFGSHKRHKTTSLGLYGIGLKDAWHWLGKTLDITSTCAGSVTTLRIGPGDIREKDGRWIGPDPKTRPAKPSDKGTRIAIEGLHADRRSPDDSTYRKLGLTFMPALEQGRQLLVQQYRKRRPIEPYRLPILNDCVVAEFDIQGRHTRIEIGLIPDGCKIEYPGFLLCYGHRVVKTSHIGTGKYSASRIAGKIILGDGWKLTKNKDDLSDFQDELEEAIHSRIRWLCEKASHLAEDIESQAFLCEVAGIMNESLKTANAKEKRTPLRESTGTVYPTQTGKKRRSAKKIDANFLGSVEVGDRNKGRRGIKLDWYQDINQETIGQFDDLAQLVYLNTENSFISRIKAARNLEALYAVAMGLVVHHQTTRDNKNSKQILLIKNGDFISGWGSVMGSIPFADDKEPQRETA